MPNNMRKKIKIPNQVAIKKLEKQLALERIKQEKQIIKEHLANYKKLEGTYYKQLNSYGTRTRYGKKDQWWRYTKIVKIINKNLFVSYDRHILCEFEGWAFECTNDLIINVTRKNLGYTQNLGIQITEQEFNAAWNKAMAKLDELP